MRTGHRIVAILTIVLLFQSCSLNRKPDQENEPPKVESSAPADDQLHQSQKDLKQRTVNASQYGKGDGLANKKTASGEPLNPNALTAAHKTLPLGTKVLVKNPATGKEVTVKINDRGPYVKGRELDLSHGAASELGIGEKGTAKVQMQVVSSGNRGEKRVTDKASAK